MDNLPNAAPVSLFLDHPYLYFWKVIIFGLPGVSGSPTLYLTDFLVILLYINHCFIFLFRLQVARLGIGRIPWLFWTVQPRKTGGTIITLLLFHMIILLHIWDLDGSLCLVRVSLTRLPGQINTNRRIFCCTVRQSSNYRPKSNQKSVHSVIPLPRIHCLDLASKPPVMMARGIVNQGEDSGASLNPYLIPLLSTTPSLNSHSNSFQTVIT